MIMRIIIMTTIIITMIMVMIMTTDMIMITPVGRSAGMIITTMNMRITTMMIMAI
jgi:hypothetical protein